MGFRLKKVESAKSDNLWSKQTFFFYIMNHHKIKKWIPIPVDKPQKINTATKTVFSALKQQGVRVGACFTHNSWRRNVSDFIPEKHKYSYTEIQSRLDLDLVHPPTQTLQGERRVRPSKTHIFGQVLSVNFLTMSNFTKRSKLQLWQTVKMTWC